MHGGQLYEGEPGAPGGPSNPAGKLNPRLGRPAAFTGWKGELPTNVYRAASNGRLDVVVTEDQVPDPNGLLLSPDYKKLYVISTGTGSGDTGRGGKGDIYVFNVGPANKLSNQQLFTDFMIDGVKCGPDDALRRRRQFVVLEQRRPCRRVQWRDGVEPASQADRPHPSAGGRRQCVLWWS